MFVSAEVDDYDDNDYAINYNDTVEPRYKEVGYNKTLS